MSENAKKDTKNDKVYIHEFIDITRQNRAKYMHHMTANWSPIGQEQRHQLCYGVWGVVGSTGPWPQVVNIWEEDGFDGVASSFRLEFDNALLQDTALEKWWAAAAGLRSGGYDRLIVPHPSTSTIEELCGSSPPPGGEVYAHEVVTVRNGQAWNLLDHVADRADAAAKATDWRLTGAWYTALGTGSECILLWTIPTWEAWAAAEKDLARDRDNLLGDTGLVQTRDRILLVDAPLSPHRTGRQPARSDRTDWTD